MNKFRLIVQLMAMLAFATISNGQSNKNITDFLKVPGPIMFDKKSYNLAWTSHPAANFYKQEYIAPGDIVSKFKSMVLIDLVTGNTDIKTVVGAKVSELKKMKEMNPIVNYEIMENAAKGEYILDFLLSQNSPDGKSLAIVERNVYRYKVFTDPSGKKGILLFGVATRSYGTDIDKFLTGLKSTRNQLITSVSQFTIPAVSISN